MCDTELLKKELLMRPEFVQSKIMYNHADQNLGNISCVMPKRL